MARSVGPPRYPDPSPVLGVAGGPRGADTGPVARSRSATNAERDVVRVCHSGLDVGGVQAQVLRSLRRLIPVDAAFFATTDPVTLQFTGAYSEEPLVAAAPRFLANELAGADVNTFTSLATSAAHVASLDSATGRARLDSERIARSCDRSDSVTSCAPRSSRARSVGGTWCLHRADGPLGFTRREAAVLARLGPHIAHALRLALLGSPGSSAARIGSPACYWSPTTSHRWPARRSRAPALAARPGARRGAADRRASRRGHPVRRSNAAAPRRPAYRAPLSAPATAAGSTSTPPVCRDPQAPTGSPWC